MGPFPERGHPRTQARSGEPSGVIRVTQFLRFCKRKTPHRKVGCPAPRFLREMRSAESAAWATLENLSSGPHLVCTGWWEGVLGINKGEELRVSEIQVPTCDVFPECPGAPTGPHRGKQLSAGNRGHQPPIQVPSPPGKLRMTSTPQ